MGSVLRAGVIGAGSMGANHARVYADLEGVELMAIAEPDPLVCNAVAQKYRCRGYSNHIAMLEREQLDLVSVVVPTQLHYNVGMDVIAAGVALLIEKPIAATIKQGQALIDAAHRHDVVLTVGHVERFNPAIIALKQQLSQHAIGDIFQIVARRVGPFPSRIADVGVVIDLSTHDIDILHYLIGSPIVRAQVELSRCIHRSHEDLLSALLRFENGVLGMLDINWLTPTKIRELSVIGAGGMFVANYLTQDLTLYENDLCGDSRWPSIAIMGVSEGRMIRQKVRRREPLREELLAFSEAVPAVSGEDALHALTKAYQLVAEGNRLITTEPPLALSVGALAP
jgi:UDP-N-acetylglucosamine 3-dehydrogenase